MKQFITRKRKKIQVENLYLHNAITHSHEGFYFLKFAGINYFRISSLCDKGKGRKKLRP